jgi:outer membrane protein OmpA-like peptidoglycan-associated protein
MKQTNSPLRLSLNLLALVLLAAVSATAQSDLQRQTIAVTYPLDQTVTVKFRGTTRLPRLTGEAKVRRAGRRGTRVELSLENLPRANELGGVYTTYVLWAISPEGRIDNLGEIKRSGSFIVNSKLDVTTPLQTFALLLTAEPHFLVRGPSRMVVLENLPPRNPGDAEIATVNVQYIGNTSDYFNDPRVPEVADTDYRKTPVSLLGARQAINLARYAGAEREAQDELREAQSLLEQAENAWRLKQDEPEVDALARRAIGLGVKAEEAAESRRSAKARRDEIARRDAAVRDAEENAATATQQIEELRASLDKEQRAREMAERDAANYNQQLRDLRTEVARMRDELQSARAEGEDAKVKLARIEGERAAEEAARQNAAMQAQVKPIKPPMTSTDSQTLDGGGAPTVAQLKQSLARYGTVKATARGLVLVLPESYWADARRSDLSAAAAAKLEPLAALLANNPDYQIVIESYTDNRGDEASLQQLTEDRARTLADRLVSAGIESTRIQASGMGTSNPVAPNTKAGRLRNRRTEITLLASDSSAQR